MFCRFPLLPSHGSDPFSPPGWVNWETIKAQARAFRPAILAPRSTAALDHSQTLYNNVLIVTEYCFCHSKWPTHGDYVMRDVIWIRSIVAQAKAFPFHSTDRFLCRDALGLRYGTGRLWLAGLGEQRSPNMKVGRPYFLEND